MNEWFQNCTFSFFYGIDPPHTIVPGEDMATAPRLPADNAPQPTLLADEIEDHRDQSSRHVSEQPSPAPASVPQVDQPRHTSGPSMHDKAGDPPSQRIHGSSKERNGAAQDPEQFKKQDDPTSKEHKVNPFEESGPNRQSTGPADSPPESNKSGSHQSNNFVDPNAVNDATESRGDHNTGKVESKKPQQPEGASAQAGAHAETIESKGINNQPEEPVKNRPQKSFPENNKGGAKANSFLENIKNPGNDDATRPETDAQKVSSDHLYKIHQALVPALEGKQRPTKGQNIPTVSGQNQKLEFVGNPPEPGGPGTVSAPKQGQSDLLASATSAQNTKDQSDGASTNKAFSAEQDANNNPGILVFDSQSQNTHQEPARKIAGPPDRGQSNHHDGSQKHQGSSPGAFSDGTPDKEPEGDQAAVVGPHKSGFVQGKLQPQPGQTQAVSPGKSLSDASGYNDVSAQRASTNSNQRQDEEDTQQKPGEKSSSGYFNDVSYNDKALQTSANSGQAGDSDSSRQTSPSLSLEPDGVSAQFTIGLGTSTIDGIKSKSSSGGRPSDEPEANITATNHEHTEDDTTNISSTGKPNDVSVLSPTGSFTASESYSTATKDSLDATPTGDAGVAASSSVVQTGTARAAPTRMLAGWSPAFRTLALAMLASYV